jgi:hypothetical protein
MFNPDCCFDEGNISKGANAEHRNPLSFNVGKYVLEGKFEFSQPVWSDQARFTA